MQRFWYQLKLARDDFRHLPFVSGRTPAAWLGVVLATVVLLGGLAIALRTPPPSGQVQAPPGRYGVAPAPTTPPGGPPGGDQGAGPAGQAGAGQAGAGQSGAALPGGSGAGAGRPGGQPSTTSPSGADTTAPGGPPPTTAPPGGGGVPATTGPVSDSTTTTTQNPQDTGHTLLPPVSVTLTLPLPLLGDASAGVSTGGGQPAG